MKVIRIVSLADGSATSHDGKYVQFANFDDYVAGILTTKDIKEAKTFTTMADALEYWRRQSVYIPLRPDGKPNRPFTAFSVEIIDAVP